MPPPDLFDKALLLQRWRRAAPGFAAHRFLLDEMELHVLERLQQIRRRFSTAILLGGDTQSAARLAAHAQVSRLIHCAPAITPGLRPAVAGDAEALPFAASSCDLIVSLGMLHWANDLPGALAQIHAALAPDGLFLALLPGGQTLAELRAAFLEGALSRQDGLSPHVSPFLELQDGGALLQRAGFRLPMADSERLHLTYSEPLALLRELRGMGQGNALLARSRRPLTRGQLLATLDAYLRQFSDEEGRVAVTIELIALTGWKAHASQPIPARRGSGNMPLGDALA